MCCWYQQVWQRAFNQDDHLFISKSPFPSDPFCELWSCSQEAPWSQLLRGAGWERLWLLPPHSLPQGNPPTKRRNQASSIDPFLFCFSQEYKATELSDYSPAKGAIMTFMFTFYFSFWNLPFHLLQFCFELSAKPSWLVGNIGIDKFPQDTFILVEWVKEQPVPAEMSQINFSCV